MEEKSEEYRFIIVNEPQTCSLRALVAGVSSQREADAFLGVPGITWWVDQKPIPDGPDTVMHKCFCPICDEG